MGTAEKKSDTLASITGKQAERLKDKALLLMQGELPVGWQWVSCSRDTVVAVSNNEPTIYYKEFLPRDIFEQIKALFRGSRCYRARRQADILSAAGLPTPQIFCWGKGKKNTFLFSQGFAGIGFEQYIKKHFTQPLPSPAAIREKRLLLQKTGAMIGKMHSSGIIHGDLRQNNLLVKKDGADFLFSIIDNERNRKWRHIPLSKNIKNLVQFAIFPGKLLSGTDLMRLFKAYGTTYPRFSDVREKKKLLRTIFLRSKTRILESRMSWKCKKYCNTLKGSKYCGQYVLDSILAKQVAAGKDLAQWFQSGKTTIKQDKSVTLKLFQSPEGDIVVKRFTAKNFLYHIKVWFNKERVFQLWKMTHYFQNLGIPVAPSMGYVLEGTGAWRTVSYFYSQYLADASNLSVLSSNRLFFLDWLDKGKIISRIAGKLAQLHNNGFSHGDTKWTNILANPATGEFWFIDLDGAAPVKSSMGHKICKDISRFMTNMIEYKLPECYLDEFITEYCFKRRLNKKQVQIKISPYIEKILKRHKKKSYDP